VATVIARLLAGSIVVTWPALLIVDGLPSDGALNGKADDLMTGGIVAVLIVGLLAAGWLKPLRVVLVAVLFNGFGAPILYEALHPTVCPVGVGGMDCIPASFNAVLALPGLLLVIAGAVVRRAAGFPIIELRPRWAAGGG
jgi:hypothetical protein